MSTQRNQVLSVKEARNFLINYQGLNTACRYTQEKGVISYFEKVGCIQYDPLNVVGRNADLTLQSRVKGYHADMLYKLLYQKRTVIDAWDKMMALYLQKDWPYFKRLRASKGKEIEAVLARRNSLQALEHLDEVREHIKKHGPSQSSSIDIGVCNPGKWGSKKLASAAMDYLFNIGELGIYSKNNVQRTYEFTEKLLKKEILEESDPFQSDDEFYEWYVKRRRGSVGMLWACNGGGWLGHFISDSDIRNSKIKRLLEKGEIEEFYVESVKNPFYIRSEDTEYLNKKSTKKEVKFLAPLDNLLWDRKMIRDIFDFDYSWEVYTPVAKRKFGYYVLPVLYGNQFIGRFEPKQYRGEEELRLENWWWEDGIKINDRLIEKLEEGMNRFCNYLGAQQVNKDDWNNMVLNR